jgi:hypothetical protein
VIEAHEDAMRVPCDEPGCGALEGQPCRWPGGEVRKTAHNSRTRKLRPPVIRDLPVRDLADHSEPIHPPEPNGGHR